MNIKNDYSGRVFLGFIKQGIWISPGQIIEVPDNVVENVTFKSMQNSGKISIVQFDPDHTRYAIRDELSGGGSVSASDIIDVIGAENVLRGNDFVSKLSQTPSAANTVSMYINGVHQEITKDYSINKLTRTISWLVGAEFDISTSMRVIFKYLKE